MKLVDMVPVITILRTENIPSLYITSWNFKLADSQACWLYVYYFKVIPVNLVNKEEQLYKEGREIFGFTRRELVNLFSP